MQLSHKSDIIHEIENFIFGALPMTSLTLTSFKPSNIKSWFKSSPEKREKALLKRYPEMANLYPHERGQAIAKKIHERNHSIFLGLTLGVAVASYQSGLTAMESGMSGIVFGYYLPSMASRFLSRKSNPDYAHPNSQKLGESGVAYLSIAKHFNRNPESHELASTKFSAKAFRDNFFMPVLAQHDYVMLDLRGAEVSDKWLKEFAKLSREFLPDDDLFNAHVLIRGSNNIKSKLQHYMKAENQYKNNIAPSI